MMDPFSPVVRHFLNDIFTYYRLDVARHFLMKCELDAMGHSNAELLKAEYWKNSPKLFLKCFLFCETQFLPVIYLTMTYLTFK